jgi:PhzF family phenazine biosynthesis protein
VPRTVTVYQVDAFTRRRFAGNPAGVVPDASSLTDAEMQLVARELGNPETAFLLPADGDDHDVRVRYFTPDVEIPFCGHATVAAHYLRARLAGADGCDVVQRCAAGRFPIRVHRAGDDLAVEMTQTPPTFDAPLGARRVRALAGALGLGAGDLRLDAPVQVVSTGHAKVIVPLADAGRLLALAPEMPRLAAVSREIGCGGIFLFALNAPGADTLATCRMFAPALGIPEDPVTGSGHGPLGAYLVKHRLVPTRQPPAFGGYPATRGRVLAFSSSQGESVGRPGVARVTVRVDAAGEPAEVRVEGDAVLVFRAEMTL